MRFARILREAREQREWSQDQLAEAADVSRPTVQRYEYGKTATPDPEAARRIFGALGLDPRLIPVVLGYVTAEEMALPPEPPRVFSPTVEKAIAILEDPRVPAGEKDALLAFIEFRARGGVAEAGAQAFNATVRTSQPGSKKAS